MIRRLVVALSGMLALTGVALCAIALVLAAFVATLVPWSEPISAAPVITVGRVHDAFQPESGKVFVLVIGNDARSGNPDRALADAIHLVGVNTKTLKGGILNFPRDSYIPIPGYGTAKINESLLAGGPQLVAQTLENLTGIRIDYWAMVGFEGFQNIINELGGVTMKIPTDVYDLGGSGAHIDAGTRHLTKWSALAYVRTRHSFPNGDIDRTTNQATFLLALLKKLRQQVARDPGNIVDWMATIKRHGRFDVSASEMFKLGILATQVDPRDIGNVTVPVSYGQVGAASVVYISGSADSIYRRFKKNASL
jgi:LCP family protein required for cell wall assembly